MPEEGPKYLALVRALRAAIRAGDLAEGAQLPTVRDLAWRLSVTPGGQPGLPDCHAGRLVAGHCGARHVRGGTNPAP